ncbi:heavy metal translocating P-type ATPase [Flavobacterium seoulense]|uniref:P-type Zn(2+) transporter n=1 Tax=Flavobacterium seoulense TaxID=1492738 RepID=A0A066WYJ9_9FLAO|nr:cation-translocating P-type ATPase [Flavobacterium seoulense]KDN55999.1 ATPase [Flavobacterium seoulense]
MDLPFKDKKFLFLLLSVSIVVTLEILSLLGIHLPMSYAPYIFCLFIIGIGHEVIFNGFQSLIKFNFSSINLLMTIAVIAALYLGQYSEAAVVIVLYVLGERLEDIGLENSKSALDKLIQSVPKTALVKSVNKEIPLDEIEIDTIIQIKPGSIIPLDGKITFGETLIDESAITGEPIAKEKQVGDKVFAGTLNTNGFIEIATTKLANDTTFAKIIQLTFEANAAKSDTQKFIQRFSRLYTPLIIVLAILIFSIPVFVMGQDFNHWLNQAVTLLVIACPCALVISTPVAIYAAIGNASAKGVLVKGGKYIEALAEIQAIAVDKTRTITYGTPVVSDVFPLVGTSRKELLSCTAGAEMFSEHPLAQAIITASKAEGFEPHAAKDFKSILGKGATAKCTVCEIDTVHVGKLEFIREYHEITPEVEKIVAQLSTEGKTSVVVSFGKGVAGIIGLTDQIKPDSYVAIQELEEQNIDVIMLTGDSEKAAHYVAKQVGISKVFGGLLPEQKSEEIKALLQQYDKVAMVGDGINDAPALALSTVGIAMGAAGSDTAIETANIALMNDQLSLIPFLIRLSKKTMKQIKFNTFGAIATKIVFILLAFFGYSNLALAIAADVGVTLIVILFSLNLMRFEKVKN